MLTLPIKPHIRRSRCGDEWLCFGADCIGWGITAIAAYGLWLKRFRRACPL